jgi:transposase
MSLEQEVERLRAENIELGQRLAASQAHTTELTQQLAVALERIIELEARVNQAKDPPAFVKPNRKKATGERQPRKKRAAEHNTSRKRAEPTRIERHALERCPDCNYRLSGESVDYTREVVELPAPQPVEVIEHQVIKRWCPQCQKWHSPQLDLSGQVFGQGRIGVRVASLVAYLRTTLRLPVRQVQVYLATLHELHLSVGEIVELSHDVRQQLQPQADELKAQAQTSPIVHADETGWRENGQNGYVWTVVTPGPEAVRYYEYAASRSHHVILRLLGDRFRGVLVSDFYGAYNLVPGRHQRCWVHLLRDLHALKEEYPAMPVVLAWATEVRQLYDEANVWLDRHVTATPEERRHLYLSLYQRACELGGRHARDASHPCKVLAKRLLRHQDELFQFVLVPGLAADNNLAERSIRPLVIMRKISGGTRSDEGSKTRLTLASLLGTWAARHLNPFLECLAALQPPAATAPA